MAKKMVKKESMKYDSSLVAYTLGILSIVLAFFQPIAAVILGIVGLFQGKKDKNALSRKAKKMNIIGIVLGLLFLILTIVITGYAMLNGSSFPN